jgi:two-component system response regulator FlrC
MTVNPDMNPISPPAIRAIWLDPVDGLAPASAQKLAVEGWSLIPVRTLDDLREQGGAADAVVVRLCFDLTVLEGVREVLAEIAPKLPVICRVGQQDLALALEASQAGVKHLMGAEDWSTAAWQKLAAALRSPSAAEAAGGTPATQSDPLALRPTASTPSPRSVVFVDPASRHLLALAQRVARAEVTALLVGPTGAGKEVLARVLHESSPRAREPFVALNCAAMPEHLIEDLLFGHEKGAFTGAHREHKGLFEQAQGGTVFLDEIGEMPIHLQSKLLRVLQEREVTRLGGQAPIRVDVRVIAATNKDLREAIVRKEFREDLYYRIATFRLRLLPLAQRPGDIMPLALHCLSQQGTAGRSWVLSSEAQAALLQYHWPGNVRELENVMRRATVLSPDGVINATHLMFDDWLPGMGVVAPSAPLPAEPVARPRLTAGPDAAADAVMPAPAETAAADVSLQRAVKKNEQDIIMATLASTRSRAEAAEKLGISPRTLRYKLARLRELRLDPSFAD